MVFGAEQNFLGMWHKINNEYEDRFMASNNLLKLGHLRFFEENRN